MFWYVVGTAVKNNKLKIHDNIPHIKGVIATRVKHKCTGKLKVFIAAGGGRWRCSRLSPVCPRAPIACRPYVIIVLRGTLPRTTRNICDLVSVLPLSQTPLHQQSTYMASFGIPFRAAPCMVVLSSSLRIKRRPAALSRQKLRRAGPCYISASPTCRRNFRVNKTHWRCQGDNLSATVRRSCFDWYPNSTHAIYKWPLWTKSTN